MVRELNGQSEKWGGGDYSPTTRPTTAPPPPSPIDMTGPWYESDVMNPMESDHRERLLEFAYPFYALRFLVIPHRGNAGCRT